MRREAVRGSGAANMPIDLVCTACGGHIGVLAGDLIASPIICPTCGHRYNLNRVERLAIWSDHVRAYSLIVSQNNGELMNPSQGPDITE